MSWYDAALVALGIRRREVPLIEQGRPDRYHTTRPLSSRSSLVKGLNVSRIASLLREADEGYPERFCELLEDIEDRDLHLVSVLGTRKRAVANLDWEIVPGGDRARDRRAAELVGRLVREIDNLEDGLLDLLDAIHKGYGIVELQWYANSSKAGVRSMLYRPQRWFRPDRDDPSILRILNPGDAVEGEQLLPYRFLVHTSRAKSGFPVRAGLGRVISWWWLYKNYAAKDWVSYAELFGSPMRVGKYPAGAKPRDIDELKEALDQLGVDASACIPADMSVEFPGDKNPRTGGEVYQNLMEFCDRAMSKAVLGATLAVEEGRKGTQALGTVHNEIRQDLLVSDAKQLARSLKRGLLAPLALFNLGPDVAVPELRFACEPPTDKKQVAEGQEVRGRVFAAARKLGIPVAKAQVADELGIRAVAEGEDVLDADPTPAPGRGAARAAFADREGLPAHLAQLDQLVDRFRSVGGIAAWRGLLDGIAAEVAKASSPEAAIGQLADVVNALELDDLAESIADATLTAELVGRLGARDGGATVVKGIPKVPPRRAIDWWVNEKKAVTAEAFDALAATHRATAFSVAGWSSLYAVQAAKDALGEVIASGGTIDDFEDAFHAIADKAGLGRKTPHQLDNLFRTNCATAYSVGRHREMSEHKTERPIWRYHAIIDDRVRPSHAAMDGRCYAADDPVWHVWGCPNGYMCRCWITSHTAAEAAANGWTVHTELPVAIATGLPHMPDAGFQTNPANKPHEFNWSRFPPEWKAALHMESA